MQVAMQVYIFADARKKERKKAQTYLISDLLDIVGHLKSSVPLPKTYTYS